LNVPYPWLEESGEGASVAVVDTILDMPVAGVEERELFPRRPTPPRRPYHSRMVMSEIRSVAPFCRVVLYPAALWEKMDVDYLFAALGDAKGADVVNLSLAYGNESLAAKGRLESLAASGALISSSYNREMPYPGIYPFVASAAPEGADVNIEGTHAGLPPSSSVSAARLSGVFALAKACDKKATMAGVLAELERLNPGLLRTPRHSGPPRETRRLG